MQVKIFSTSSAQELETQLNDYFSALKNMVILDMKYDTMSGNNDIPDVYSVLLVLQDTTTINQEQAQSVVTVVDNGADKE